MLVMRQHRDVSCGRCRQSAEVAIGRRRTGPNCLSLAIATAGIAISLAIAAPCFAISVGFPQFGHSGVHDNSVAAGSICVLGSSCRSSSSSNAGIRELHLVTRGATAKPVSRLQLKDMEVGQELKGLVVRLAPFGCFVDVGAEKEGLVHISQVAGGYVEDIEAVVEPGQMVTVWVKNVDVENTRLSLSMRPPVSIHSEADDDTDEFDEFGFSSVDPEEWFEGTVVSIADFGIFVMLSRFEGGPSHYGLVHISNIRDGFVEHPGEEATVGQKVRVRVVDVPEDGRLKLSMREPRKEWIPIEEQDISGFVGIKPTTWLQGRVDHCATVGIFVEVVAPKGGAIVQGLVHISEIREGFVVDPEQEVSINEVVKVRVVKVDVAEGKLHLSMKPLF